jgi:hypothetical protein
MKLIQIKNKSLFGHKSAAVAALITGIWLSGMSSSFGITIGLASGSSPDCSGSVSVQGNVSCSKSCEASAPVVTVVNSLCPGNSDQPSVSVSCSGDVWTGTWGPTSISLSKGVNVLTASDDCGSATLKVTSNGGGGPSLSWSGTPLCTSSQAGFSSTLTMCCLTPDGSGYSLSESVTAAGCGAGLNQNLNPVPFTVANGCGSVSDSNYVARNGRCNCTRTFSQTLTVKDPSGNVIGTFSDGATVTFGPCPAGNITFAMTGDGVGANNSSATTTCP